MPHGHSQEARMGGQGRGCNTSVQRDIFVDLRVPEVIIFQGPYQEFTHFRRACEHEILASNKSRQVMLAGQWRLGTTLNITLIEGSKLGQSMTCVSRPLGKRWEKKEERRERCHTEVDAPAKQDGVPWWCGTCPDAPGQRP